MENNKLPVDIENDFILNVKMFEKYIPLKLRTKTKEILDISLNLCTLNPYYFKNMGFYLSEHIFNTVSLTLRSPRDIYELNFISIQYLLNLVDKYNINPKKINILIWGCGTCVVDYYLDKIGFKITSYDNWSQIKKNIVVDFLNKLDNNNINLVNKLEDLYNMNFDILFDTGNYMNNKKIIQNPNVKIIFTWCVERLDHKSNTKDNLIYLENNFTRINLPTITVFIRN